MGMVEVVVIGAGPFGLVTAAHLRASGVEPLVFGEVMGFWKALPKGMLLRSEWAAAHLTDPENSTSLFDYEIASRQQLPRRIPMTEWARYGEWFQQTSVPNVDPRLVEWVERTSHGFSLQLDDGDVVTAKRVIVATGLRNFAKRPAFAAELPVEFVTHTADVRDFAWLAGKNVAVVGCGQSALESSALLRDVDAQVEVISRQPIIRWLSYGEANHRERTLKQRILRPPGSLGPIGISWIVQLPELYRAMPEMVKPFIYSRASRPAGPGWLRERVNGVVYTVSESIDSVTVRGDKLRLELASGGNREVDHLVLGSGYDVQASGFRFLSPELIREIDTRHGQPDLHAGFESSVPGLHFIGPGSEESYGPLVHSVAGTQYVGKSVARAVRQVSVSRRYVSAPISIPTMNGVSVSAGPGR